MKKAMKVLLFIILALLIIFIVISIYYLRLIFPPRPSVNDMQKLYEENKSAIHQIADTFAGIEFETVYILSPYEDYHYVSVTRDGSMAERYEYNNEATYDSFNTLFDGGITGPIQKTDNYIMFQCWSTRDSGCGMVYSLDGKTPEIDKEFVAKEQIFEPLEDEGWYYYYSKIL